MRKRCIARGLVALILTTIGIGSRGQDLSQPPPPPQPAPAPIPSPAFSQPPAPDAAPDVDADGDVGDGNGLQVLTRGPIHEAFAEPVVFDPRPGPVVPKEPPPPVEEMPPAEKPEGANVAWIPGYWAWDDQRQDYLWISGVWRDVPPDRQWMPGYWSQADGGFRWTPGFWAAAGQEQVEYLPEPPASLEAGPSSPPPSPDSIWTPGTWIRQDDRYAWQPGAWVEFQPDWTWVPAQYVSTPGGYVFNDGYWDRPLDQRGQAFAPVYFQQPLYQQAGYRYTPSLALVASALASSLFVRPSTHQYYFGDYYDASNFQSGIYPWYSFHQSRYGYDPLFANYSRLQARSNPGWLDGLHQEYRYRREHPEARPAPTYAQQRAIAKGRAGNLADGANAPRDRAHPEHLILAQPIRQLTTRANSPVRFERIDEARRKELAARTAQVHQFREQRRQREITANQAGPGPRPEGGPHARPVALPRSPIAHAGPGREEAGEANRRGPNPPPRPRSPGPDLQARPLPPDQVARHRFEPTPDRQPHQVLRPNPEAAGPQGRPGPGAPQPHPEAPKAQPRPEVPKAQPHPEAPKAQPRPEQPKHERPPAAKEAAKKARRGG